MMKKLYKQQHGSVMMEYVILLFFFAILVYTFWHGMIFDMQTHELREGGKYIQGFFQRLTAGIVLPVP